MCGARRSTSRASARAARRTSSKLQRRSMRTLTCTPREPDVFGQPVRPKSRSVASTTCATWRSLRPCHARHRIEVHPQLVRVIQILGADRMRVQLEAGQVREPGERRGVARHHFVGASSRWKAKRYHLDPRWTRVRRPLLIEEFAGDAVGIAHQHGGPAAGAAQRALGHRQVVAHEVELRVSRLRKQHLARIRDRDLPAVDQNDLGGIPASATHPRQRIPRLGRSC